jgi:ankyrin repeat protein
MSHRTRLLLSSLLLLAVLVGVPALLTWRAVRQERLDRALITAVKQKKADTVVLLLRQGADPNAGEHSEGVVSVRQAFQSLILRLRHRNTKPGQERNTALMSAMVSLAYDPVIVNGPDKSSQCIVRALLDAGADPNCQDNNKDTPLFLAVLADPSLVPRLLEKGADVDTANRSGWTPLMMAATMGYSDITAALLRRHVNINAKNDRGRTAYKIARLQRNREVAKLLKQAGAKE